MQFLKDFFKEFLKDFFKEVLKESLDFLKDSLMH